MRLLNFFFKPLYICKSLYIKSSSDRYCAYLRNKGVKIGGGTFVRPKTTHIDLTRPSLVSIGANCYMNENFTILTHDWVANLYRNIGYGFFNSGGRVTIGNNVNFGQNVIVLKGVTIGDNCFIGAGSVVTKSIPSDSIAAGVPCKVICSIDDFYNKKLKKSEEEALDYAKSIFERFNRRPVPSDFWEEFIWFVSGDEIGLYPELPIKTILGKAYDDYARNHKAKYSSFEEFLRAAGL